ncbi:hypothetical protein [Flavobacterium sp.]|uniref:hypothetical protein n=1 Tax=Flavobacterium sp. TaxID=239 RepID=UPI001B7B25AB|nr:hypothetical protein [Flavobacterium sp.]MBP6180912.1 hypothetical protein [Flavobacterium sp.]
MPSELNQKLEYVSGHRENRQKLAHEVIANPFLFSELIQICFIIWNKNAPKACWILEFISYEKLEWLQPNLDFFCLNIRLLKDESAIRPMAKVCQLLVSSHFKNSSIALSEIHLQQITETCFDWLINDTKVASKCYSIRTLYQLGNHFDWVHPELKVILEKDYANHTAAYKAVGREILKKIK